MKRNQTERWNQMGLVLCFFTLMVFIGGCGAGRTMVLKPTDATQHYSSVELSEGSSTVKVPNDFKETFSKELARLIYEEGGFQNGSALTIKYRFIQFNPGNQFSRWMWGGLGSSGKGTLTVEAKYFDTTDKELAMIHAEGEISSGALGGDFDFAIKKCATEIAEYTKQNFK